MIHSLFVLPVGRVPPLRSLPPLHNLASWVATDLFGFGEPYDRSSFRLLQSQFRWVQDFPFNRRS
jgi:hypothetical protein